MSDFLEAVPDASSQGSQPHARPSAETAAPAAWEHFKTELDAATSAGEGQEVSAITNVFSELMRAGVDADKVFELVVTSAATLTGATGAAIALAEGGEFVCSARYSSIAPPLGTRLDANSGLSGLCVLLRCDDAALDPRVDGALSLETGIRSISVVPLIKDGKLVGIFELLSTRAHAFDRKATEMLERMSNLVVLTLNRMGELRGKTIEHNASTRWWRILGLMALAFLIGFFVSRLLGRLLFH